MSDKHFAGRKITTKEITTTTTTITSRKKPKEAPSNPPYLTSSSSSASPLPDPNSVSREEFLACVDKNIDIYGSEAVLGWVRACRATMKTQTTRIAAAPPPPSSPSPPAEYDRSASPSSSSAVSEFEVWCKRHPALFKPFRPGSVPESHSPDLRLCDYSISTACGTEGSPYPSISHSPISVNSKVYQKDDSLRSASEGILSGGSEVATFGSRRRGKGARASFAEKEIRSRSAPVMERKWFILPGGNIMSPATRGDAPVRMSRMVPQSPVVTSRDIPGTQKGGYFSCQMERRSVSSALSPPKALRFSFTPTRSGGRGSWGSLMCSVPRLRSPSAPPPTPSYRGVSAGSSGPHTTPPHLHLSLTPSTRCTSRSSYRSEGSPEKEPQQDDKPMKGSRSHMGRAYVYRKGEERGRR